MNILSATDFLPKSEAAVDRAAFLADLLEADLAMVHAVAPAAPDGHTLDERLRNARSRLARRAAPPDWRWNSTPHIAVQFGPPARVVLDQAHRRRSRLVVVGPHRGGALPTLLGGSIVERVLDAAICPLLIARQDVRSAYREVVIALDDARGAGDVVRTVESLHLANEKPPIVVHAHEPPHAGMMNIVGIGGEATEKYVTASRTQAEARIRGLLQQHSSDADRYQIMVVERRPAAAIMASVERLQPDLVVLGSAAGGQLRRAMLGSVASEVAHSAQCDVLIVPARSVATRHDSGTHRRSNLGEVGSDQNAA